MSTTITLGQSIGFAQSYGGFRALTVGASNEPAVTAANILIQMILAPPFSWNWNRNSATFLTVPGKQDYPTSVPTFGFIEKASSIPAASVTSTSLTGNVATYIAANSFTAGHYVTVTGCTNGGAVLNVTYQPIVAATATSFTVAITNGNLSSQAEAGLALSGNLGEFSQMNNVLGGGNESGQAYTIAPQIDNNSGTITFRLLPVPTIQAQVTVLFQQRQGALITNASNTWAPIPDHYSMVYQWGFLALMMAYWSDPRWTSASQKFVANLLGVAEGLKDEQKNIFQQAWLSSITEMQVTGQKSSQGVQARGGL